jgi:glycosyltransferase involved in cell wall biosynthesis
MKFSIVTPCCNQNRFLDRCMRSVLGQEAGDPEYIVVDGGSTDGSVETIQKHAARLAWWISRPGWGLTGALNEGFAHGRGEIMGWIDPDDMLAPWALRVVQSLFDALPEVEWITTLFPLEMDEEDTVVTAQRAEGWNAEAFYRGRNIPMDPGFFTFPIRHESTFWRRSLWEKAGGQMDDGMHLAGDFELWARFFQHAALYAVSVPLGCFRSQPKPDPAEGMDSYLEECRAVMRRYSRRVPSRIETAARRIARLIPRRVWPLTGLAYPVAVIRQEGRGSEWKVFREWIL